MRIVLAILLNTALLAVLLPWLRQQWRWAAYGRWRMVFAAGLGLRMLAGGIRTWHPTGDAKFMSFVGHIVTDKIWANPEATWDILTRAVTVLPKGEAPYDFVYQNTSNTWILMKILGVLNLASLENDWVNAFYVSLFAFIGCWQLVRVLATAFPATPAGTGVVAFLLWPSVWFWATGISKEAVLLSSGAWLTARLVSYFYDTTADSHAPRWAWVVWWPGTAVLAMLHFGMRYFFALPLLGVLGGVAVGRWLRRYSMGQYRLVQAAALAAVLGVGIWLAPQVNVAFSMNKFTNQVIRVYNFDVAHSIGRPHFEYPELRPTVESIAAHAPLAAVNAVTRPWLGESWSALYLAASLENTALLGLIALAVWAVLRGRIGNFPFGLGLGLGVFCLILAILIGLTTPNLGSLNRYRSELLPYLLLLLLQHDYAATALRRLRLDKAATA
ncbi:hypothetical protein [Hymenobacter terrenus]|uniref:hypothetical protein n=1 Tax=Hymenobacter terrenus TaxID=1629124 RepID=UPI000B12246B|nr:hypothetical protein [Hymenobacter terrenus]